MSTYTSVKNTAAYIIKLSIAKIIMHTMYFHCVSYNHLANVCFTLNFNKICKLELEFPPCFTSYDVHGIQFSWQRTRPYNLFGIPTFYLRMTNPLHGFTFNIGFIANLTIWFTSPHELYWYWKDAVYVGTNWIWCDEGETPLLICVLRTALFTPCILRNSKNPLSFQLWHAYIVTITLANVVFLCTTLLYKIYKIS